MALLFKFFAAAVLCYTVAFCKAETSEDPEQSTWKIFFLSHTVDPDVHSNYRSWSTQTWLALLKQRDDFIRDDCPKCDSLFKYDFNTMFIATKKEIFEAFSRNNDSSKQSEAAWSNKAFQTYVLLNGSVFDCGLEYFYAQVDEEGLPTDLLGMSDNGNRLNSGNSNVQISCQNIDSKSGPTGESDELDGEESDILENAPEYDTEDEIPEQDLNEDISEYDFEEVPEDDFIEENSERDVEEETDEDIPEDNQIIYENNVAEDIDDIDDVDVDTNRPKRQLQLPETRQKIYKNLDTRILPKEYIQPANGLHIFRSAKISEKDLADETEDDLADEREDYAAHEPEDYEADETEDDLAVEPEDDLADETEDDLVDETEEDNSDVTDQDLTEDSEAEGNDDDDDDATRTKRQIRIPRPTPTFPNPKHIKTVYYPKPNWYPKPLIRKIRSAVIVRPRRRRCPPGYVRCNPLNRNCNRLRP
ncbi:unnamed protein product, partial [Allacma fusca]